MKKLTGKPLINLLLICVLMSLALVRCRGTETPSATETPVPSPTPVSARGYIEIGDNALFAGDEEGAKEAYQRAAEVEPGLLSAELRPIFVEALDYRTRQEALRKAEEVFDEGSEDSEAWALYALILSHNHEIARAQEAAEKALELDDENVLTQIAAADSSLVQNKTEEAIGAIETALDIQADHPIAMLLLLHARIINGELDQAIEIGRQLREKYPAWPRSYLGLASAHQWALEYEEAQEALEAVLEFDPQNLHALLALEDLAIWQDEEYEALDWQEQAEDLAPGLAEVVYGRGILNVALEAPEQAIKDFTHALELDEAFLGAYLVRGQVNIQLDRCDEAREDFRAVLDRNPDSAYGHLGLALSFGCTGDYDRASQGFAAAAELAPVDYQVQLEMGFDHALNDEMEEAWDALDIAIGYGMDRVNLYNRLGFVRYSTEFRSIKAISNYEQALAFDPDSVEGWTGLGYSYLDEGNLEMAKDSFGEALTLDREYGDAHVGMGSTFFLLDDFERAINEYDEAIEAGIYDAYLLRRKAHAHAEVGEFDQAISAYAASVESETNPLPVAMISDRLILLQSGQYWLTESEAFSAFRETYVDMMNAAGEAQMPLLGIEVVEEGEERTLHIRAEVSGDKYDDAYIITNALVQALFASEVVDRIEPRVFGGLTIDMLEPGGRPVLQAYIRYGAMRNVADGIFTDLFDILEGMDLIDYRRPANQLNPAAAVAEIGREVEGLRGIRTVDPVPVEVLTRSEYRELLESTLTDEQDSSFEHTRIALILLGLLDPDVDVAEAVFESSASTVMGFYDGEENVLYVITEGEGGMSLIDEMTIAHEYTHVLQDQVYGFGGEEFLESANEDHLLALRAIAEGEANRVMWEYVDTAFTEFEKLVAESSSRQLSESITTSATQLFVIDEAFVYEEGTRFLDEVAPGAYWPDVEAIYDDPPLSSEQVLHPEKYGDEERDNPQEVDLIDLRASLGAGWSELEQDVYGEYFLRIYLTYLLSVDAGRVAAAGWDGDAYALLENEDEGRHLLVWQIVWDEARDAREFSTAMRLGMDLDEGFEGTLRDLRGSERDLRWEGEDRDVHLAQRGLTTWVIFGESSEDFDPVLAALDLE